VYLNVAVRKQNFIFQKSSSLGCPLGVLSRSINGFNYIVGDRALPFIVVITSNKRLCLQYVDESTPTFPGYSFHNIVLSNPF
jgi:hypothetical protein